MAASAIERYRRATVVYRSALADAPDPGSAQIVQAASAIQGSVGAPLPFRVRAPLERLFAADLSSIRVHSGPTIARAARNLSARAMTVGSDVFLPGGLPDGPSRAELPVLAHEMTHAVRHVGVQRPATPLTLANRASSEEQEAEHVEQVIAGAFDHPTTSQTRSPLASASLPLARPSGPSMVRRVDSAAGATATSISAPTIDEPAAPGASTAAAPAAAGAAHAAPDPHELADQVYAIIEQRLVAERERWGFIR